jgi:hypothetical protein
MVSSMPQETPISKKRRGPAPTGQGTPVLVRMLPGLLSALDSYRGDMTRPEAVRMLVKTGLIRANYLAIADEDK